MTLTILGVLVIYFVECFSIVKFFLAFCFFVTKLKLQRRKITQAKSPLISSYQGSMLSQVLLTVVNLDHASEVKVCQFLHYKFSQGILWKKVLYLAQTLKSRELYFISLRVEQFVCTEIYLFSLITYLCQNGFMGILYFGL